MVDTILRYYADKLTELGSALELRIDVPEELPAAEPDVCAILENLLDNALKACQSVGADAWVRVVMEAERQRLIIVVDNTVPTPPQGARRGISLQPPRRRRDRNAVGEGHRPALRRRCQAEVGGRVFYAAVMLDP